jgi:competence/damage-inducible protein CinA-like protein
MDLELLTIGTELLLGFTVDTNAAEIGRALSAAGVRVVRKGSVGDSPDAIRRGIEEALGRSGAVLCTGGLGPTADDITKKVVADLYGMPLDFHEDIWQFLVDRFARFGRKPAEKNRSQAEVPRGATVLPNRWGTAPGLWFEGAPGLVILLPGVPSEMRGLLQHEVLPRLAPRAGSRVIRSRSLRTTGVPESTLAERISGIEDVVAPLSLAYLPGTQGVDLRLTAWSLPAAEADSRLAAGVDAIRARAAEWIYGEDDVDLAAVVLAEARRRGWKIATAESCTGGGVGARLTDIPGSSDVYLGGVVAYDNSVKEALLDVPAALIGQHGAVSEPVAAEMVRGVTRRLGAQLGVAVTGIAGPSGGTAEKPVGLVYIATAVNESVLVTRSVIPGDRGEIRARAAQIALNRLRLALAESPSSPA